MSPTDIRVREDHMATTPEQGISDADIDKMFANTESEIFEEAVGDEPSENDGDRQLEKMEDIHGDAVDSTGEVEEDEEGGDDDEPDEGEPEEPETDEEEDELPVAAEATPPLVPSHRLREEAAARRILEAKNAELEARLRTLEQQSKPAEAEKPAKPDMFSDPEKYEAWVLQQAEDRAMARFQQAQAQDREARVETSLQAAARGQRGYEFQAAYGALTSLNPQDPQAQAVVRSIVEASDPASALFEWWDSGDGPEFRENLLAQLQGRPPRQAQRAVRQSGQRVRTVTRGPVSLNGASGKGTHREIDPDLYDDSEGSVFDYATR